MNRDRGLSVPAHTEAMDVTWAVGGDHEAFERLYHAHVGRIYALVRRMTQEDVAEDLTQEVFIRAWQKLGTFRGDALFGTWLHRLAVNHVLTRRETLRRREARRVRGNGILDRAVDRIRRNPGVAMDFEAALEQLPEGARNVFVLYDVEGYGHEEISDMMGISIGTSKSQLHRARMLLRRYLD